MEVNYYKIRKIFSSVLCCVMLLGILVTMCGCGGGKSIEQSPQDYARDAVRTSARLEYYGAKINGNELTSSFAMFSTVEKVSDTEYTVYGEMTMTDVYGNKYTADYSCPVTGSGTEWYAGRFSYGSWQKQ